MAVTLQPADIFLTRGTGIISRLIQFFSRGIGEPRTKVNHVGLVVEGGPIDSAIVVEALTKVKRHKLFDQYVNTKHGVAVYRPLNVEQEDLDKIVVTAEGYVGRTYGYLKILLHLLDWALLGAYVFRRLGQMDRYPICSWLVAHSYKKANLYFGVKPGAATPDDIWDFVRSQTGKYKEVRKLSRLPATNDLE